MSRWEKRTGPSRSVWPKDPRPAATGPAPGGSHGNRYASSFPFRNRGHRGQDALDIAAGAQAEMGAAVIQQVELDIAAAPLGLFMAFLRRPGFGHAAADDLRLDVQECFAHGLGKAKVPVPVAAVVVIVENAAHAARLTAMGQPEIG